MEPQQAWDIVWLDWPQRLVHRLRNRPGIRWLENLAQDRVHTALLDVTIHKDVQAYFADQPDFDGIVNMAGWVHHGTLTQTSIENWHRSFAVNLDSMFYVLHAAIPGLIRKGGGSIVNMSSLASSVKGFHFGQVTAHLRQLLSG